MTATPAETWRPHPDHPFYDISDQGRVRSWRNMQYGRRAEPVVMRQKQSTRGYACVKLRGGGRNYHMLVHRLVLEAFVGPCPDDMQACHRDDDKSDNRLISLRWDTPRANCADMLANGRRSRHSAKLTDDDARVIRELVGQGVPQASLARHYGVSKNSIGGVVHGRTHCHA